MSVQSTQLSRSRRIIMLVAVGLAAMLAVAGAASAKDEGNGPTVLPTPGAVSATTGCVGNQSNILHPPSSPDIPWPFGAGIVAAAESTVEIVNTTAGSIARVTIVDASQNLPMNGELSGPDAFSFNLPYALDEDNIRVISPSTFKRFRVDSTPGGGAPFGRFGYQVRRGQHDQTPFIFEIAVPWVDLSLADFGVNADGYQFVTRINGIYWTGNGQNENRAFSACMPPPSDELPPGDGFPGGGGFPFDQLP